jgi:hypothetical protein
VVGLEVTDVEVDLEVEVVEVVVVLTIGSFVAHKSPYFRSVGFFGIQPYLTPA